MNAGVLTVSVELGERSYRIEIASGVLKDLGRRMLHFYNQPRPLLMITDKNVHAHHGERAASGIREAEFPFSTLVLPPGEETKSLANLSLAYDRLIERNLPRQGAIVALGGGVIGDLAGFAAATYLRGIDFIQAPTTLLAMVDSSVGGKTGINHSLGKNLIGAFWQPRLVFIDTDCLRTLPPRELSAGLAEVIKHGVIADASYFDFVESNIARILAIDPEAMMQTVEGSCRIKAKVVGEDERELSGRRAILNFGHTVGHAIETAAGYGTFLHGEAVAIGMEAAGRLALKRKMWKAEEMQRLSRLLDAAGLPRKIPSSVRQNDLFYAMKRDKKIKDKKIRFVLPTSIGERRPRGGHSRR